VSVAAPSGSRAARLWAWLDARVGLADVAYLARKKQVPVHRHTVWYYFGGMTLFLFAVQVITGILLLLYYRPSAEEAYESIQFLMTDSWCSRPSSISSACSCSRPTGHPGS
jgi:cytochrome b6